MGNQTPDTRSLLLSTDNIYQKLGSGKNVARAIENIYYTADNDCQTQQIYYTFGIDDLNDHLDDMLTEFQNFNDSKISKNDEEKNDSKVELNIINLDSQSFNI